MPNNNNNNTTIPVLLLSTSPSANTYNNKPSTKLQTDCKKEHIASLQCIQDNYETKDSTCQPYFEQYKECRRKEHQAKLEENRKKYGTTTNTVTRKLDSTSSTLFQQQESTTTTTTTTTTITTGTTTTSCSDSSNNNDDSSIIQVGMISFDLDDTLFPTSETVHDANTKQIQYMNELFNKKEYFTITSFLQSTREIRQSLEQPVTYTTLRKMAIRKVLEDKINEEEEKEEEEANSSKNVVTMDNLDKITDNVFDVWLQERHDAASRYLFQDAISSLQQLKDKYPDVCIAAITNGRGNPIEMINTDLPNLFNFCISGEDDNVFPNRKPHAGIYDIALEKYRELFPHHDNNDNKIWIHVGDCLANDVGASADCGAYAVWYYPDETASIYQSGNGASYSTASKGDIAKREELANQAQEKVATRISSLSQLINAIDELLESAKNE